ncbi:MAG: hypothetical protein AAF367_16010 [Pseudomonadota bacterium]
MVKEIGFKNAPAPLHYALVRSTAEQSVDRETGFFLSPEAERGSAHTSTTANNHKSPIDGFDFDDEDIVKVVEYLGGTGDNRITQALSTLGQNDFFSNGNTVPTRDADALRLEIAKHPSVAKAGDGFGHPA